MGAGFVHPKPRPLAEGRAREMLSRHRMGRSVNPRTWGIALPLLPVGL